MVLADRLQDFDDGDDEVLGVVDYGVLVEGGEQAEAVDAVSVYR